MGVPVQTSSSEPQVGYLPQPFPHVFLKRPQALPRIAISEEHMWSGLVSESRMTTHHARSDECQACPWIRYCLGDRRRCCNRSCACKGQMYWGSAFFPTLVANAGRQRTPEGFSEQKGGNKWISNNEKELLRKNQGEEVAMASASYPTLLHN